MYVLFILDGFVFKDSCSFLSVKFDIGKRVEKGEFEVFGVYVKGI